MFGQSNIVGKTLLRTLFSMGPPRRIHSICGKSDFGIFNLVEGVNPIR